ncbi:hypothetical protein HBI71_179330 [Parastagonospora nodorum]|nr:hypothetical protein HBI71_179330 [Parastagonospora nodorum]KAH5327125.1 hypothetical protein HBI12_078720 [Parastagonospora nodorum]KAH5407104.1 hypothetical protein HBI47_172780 [Parastagonospora nodorum]KAH6374538.1 hypothetical protein HBI34_069140 [Parastagonospora nodorum]
MLSAWCCTRRLHFMSNLYKQSVCPFYHSSLCNFAQPPFPSPLLLPADFVKIGIYPNWSAHMHYKGRFYVCH